MQIRLYRQPKGRAFLAEFRLRGRRRSSDRLTSTQTKLHQELLRAHPEDLRRAYLVNPDTAVYVSAISCAEIACAVERHRIELDRHWKQWFRYYLDLNGWICLPIDLDVIEEAYSLPDPFH